MEVRQWGELPPGVDPGDPAVVDLLAGVNSRPDGPRTPENGFWGSALPLDGAVRPSSRYGRHTYPGGALPGLQGLARVRTGFGRESRGEGHHASSRGQPRGTRSEGTPQGWTPPVRTPGPPPPRRPDLATLRTRSSAPSRAPLDRPKARPRARGPGGTRRQQPPHGSRRIPGGVPVDGNPTAPDAGRRAADRSQPSALARRATLGARGRPPERSGSAGALRSRRSCEKRRENKGFVRGTRTAMPTSRPRRTDWRPRP